MQSGEYFFDNKNVAKSIIQDMILSYRKYNERLPQMFIKKWLLDE